MRTLNDLHGAFALLEREADEYAASHDEILVSSADVIPLAAVPSRRRRVRPALWITAAAVAAAAVAGSLVLTNALGGRTHAVGGVDPSPEPALIATQLQVPITVPTSLGFEVAAIQANGSFQTLELVNHASRVDVTLSPPDSPFKQATSGTQVDIDGTQGRYTDDNLVPHPGQTPVATTAAGPNYGDQFGRSVTWRIATTGEWVLLQTQGPPVSESQLLALARGLRFTATDPTPVTSVFSLPQAPEGLRLYRVDTEPYGVADNPPFDLRTPVWHTDVVYMPVGGGGDGIEISVNTSKHDGYADPADPTGQWAGMGVGPWTKGATAVTVRGWKGFWDSTKHSLSLKISDDVYLNIAETGAWNSTPSMSYSELAAVARSVTVVRHPEDRSTWLDAAKALPLGA